jgi:4,4'-diaponeurosporenoate glycosyltransferase
MTLNIIELIIVFIGLAVTPILFYRFPRITTAKSDNCLPKLSVIIPARNEEKSLPLLLEDLRGQSCKPFEIICVDDESSDATAQIAESYDARVILLKSKPDGWVGKTWACQNGANAAEGELLLFLDADVRLGEDGIQRLLQSYSDQNCTISVQPYHCTETWYEQSSLLFNLLQIAANGTALPKPFDIGLYGPIFLISIDEYKRIGGHESVQDSIVEDMALGQRLKEAGIPYRLFVGDPNISFRMYNGGIRSLFQGWIKNIATCAMKTPPALFWMVFFWITSMTSVSIHVVIFAASDNMPWLILYSALYVVWLTILHILSKKIGRFRLLSIVFYPVLILVLFVILSVSLFKKIFGLKVIWKGRSVGEEEKACK